MCRGGFRDSGRRGGHTGPPLRVRSKGEGGLGWRGRLRVERSGWRIPLLQNGAANHCQRGEFDYNLQRVFYPMAENP